MPLDTYGYPIIEGPLITDIVLFKSNVALDMHGYPIIEGPVIADIVLFKSKDAIRHVRISCN